MSVQAVPIILVDGSSYLYRAFHALPPLTNSAGQSTGAVKGVISMLRRMCKDYPDSPVAVVFDAPGKTFRDEMFPEYKANRPPMPDELRVQIEPLHEIIKAQGLPLISIEGVEADDVIGTLARAGTTQGMETLIISGDKDLAQLVGPQVMMYDSMKDVLYDRDGVKEKFGVHLRNTKKKTHKNCRHDRTCFDGSTVSGALQRPLNLTCWPYSAANHSKSLSHLFILML